MNIDIHALYHNKAIGKAKAFLRGVHASGSGVAFHGSHVGGQGSLSKSPGTAGGGGSIISSGLITSEINRRDHLGRSVLHLAASETDEWSIVWLEMLLSVPGLQLNAVDLESGWSALHRALYSGNITAARQLLTRNDVDTNLKDHEGLTPFDLYNSTVEGTNPFDSSSLSTPTRLELFTWGSNRNFVLGFSGDGDRVPERVKLQRDEGVTGFRAFEPLRVRDIAMARLHTSIVTDEKKNNIRLCGYGTGGRLGQNSQTQFTFSPLRNFPYQVSSVALSPDHTVVITTSGDVWTFGLNRSAQLGYVMDSSLSTTTSKSGLQADEPIQSTPRRVVGALKKETVLGACASRSHTAVFTADSLYSWGTNRGQLGYSTPEGVQIMPRKVTIVSQPVVMLTATESATACLLESKDVLILQQETFLRITFPMARFPSKMQAYRPPQVSAKPNIVKIASCGSTLAALSSLGDVFTLTLEPPVPGSSADVHLARAVAPKPQRIWSLRRKFTAVTDVGVGSDSTIILCTVSGHVYVRAKRFEGSASKLAVSPTSRNASYKFSRVPNLQRCIKVAANSTGGFAAIRADVPLKSFNTSGPTVAEDLLSSLPHWSRICTRQSGKRNKAPSTLTDSDDESETDARIERDVRAAEQILLILKSWSSEWEEPANGSDIFVYASYKKVPVHSVILAARSSEFAEQLAGLRAGDTLKIECLGMTLLLLLHYLYSDELIAVWDGRIGSRLQQHALIGDKVPLMKVKTELLMLSQLYNLPALSNALESHVTRCPAATLSNDTMKLFKCTEPSNRLLPDVILELADNDLPCHSIILRSRCVFFTTFYDDPDWTTRQPKLSNGMNQRCNVVRFDMKHIHEKVMKLVIEHIYGGGGIELFDAVGFSSADEYIDYVIHVLAVANELLLDQLKLICSAVLQTFVSLQNVCSILVDAAHYEANDLARACMYFLASSMETVLERGLLDDLPPDLLAALSLFVRQRQGARMPISRSGLLVHELVAKHAEWIADLDVGRPTGAAKRWKPYMKSPGPSPNLLSPGSSPDLRPRRSPQIYPQISSPSLSPSLKVISGSDEPFSMDDDFALDQPANHTRMSQIANSKSKDKCEFSGEGQNFGPSSALFIDSHPSLQPRSQPWKISPARLSSSPASLRNIIAAESIISARQIRTSVAEEHPVFQAPSDTLHGKLTDASSAGSPRRSFTPNLSSATGWRSPERTKASFADIQKQQRTPGTVSTLVPDTNRSARISSHIPKVSSHPPTGSSQTLPSSRSSATRMGSVARATKGVFGSADVPWTNYSPAQIELATSTTHGSMQSLAPSPSSFAAIQSQQKEEVDAFMQTKVPRSFAEVMAQEVAAARQKEEESAFTKWWEAETSRMREEADALASPPQSASNDTLNTNRSTGGGRRGSSGRGRGGSRTPNRTPLSSGVNAPQYGKTRGRARE